jgi:hydrogen peroxide-dependent heme synthase
MPVSDLIVNTLTKDLPAVPLTLEGAAILHQMMRLRRTAWRALTPAAQEEMLREAAAWFAPLEGQGASAVFSLIGHKGDLLFLHFRKSFDELHAAELQVEQLRLRECLEPATSYLSVIELGLYESTVKLYASLVDKGIEPNSPEWNHSTAEVIERQREAMRPRLFPKIPDSRYLCFYPMDRRRGEVQNWYRLPIEERQRQMEEHGLVGRRYAGQVQQIISGSIGFDDWEWGVDLFAQDPLVFKKLIYEMRFDEVSAVYALFGTFYFGIRCPAAKLGELLRGALPAKSAAD